MTGAPGHDGKAVRPDPIGDNHTGQYTRAGLALATAAGAAFGIAAVLNGFGIPATLLGHVLGAVVGTTLVRGTSYDSAVGAAVAVGVVAIGAWTGTVVPGALVGGEPARTVGAGKFLVVSPAGIPAAFVGAYALNWIRNRVRTLVID